MARISCSAAEYEIALSVSQVKQELFDAILAEKPKKIVLLDRGFYDGVVARDDFLFECLHQAEEHGVQKVEIY